MISWPAIAFAAFLLTAPSGCPAPAVTTLLHSGMGGASAAVDVGGGRIAVANDEDNRLRIFRTDADGPPESSVDVSGFLHVEGRNIEADLEGAARIGDRIYWIGSHGRAKDGRLRPNRQRLFATAIITAADGAKSLRPVGFPCRNLLDQLVGSAAAQDLGLGVAMGIAPNEPGGLNIEALSEGPGGSLYIGFRSPVPAGKALVVPLLNPDEVVDGKPARFGTALRIDLGGRGLRDMAWNGRSWYLLGGGGGGEDRKPRLYRWTGGTSPAEHLAARGLKDLNPEALTVLGTGEAQSLLVCSDDGKRNATQGRSFRSIRLQPDAR